VKVLRRRDIIQGVAGWAAAWPIVLRAQPARSTRLVGVLTSLEAADIESRGLIDVFRQELQKLGWEQGRNLQIDDRWAAGDLDRLAHEAAELVSGKPEVILGYGTPVVAVLHRATQTIPIVFANANDPVGSGFVKSIARPEGNITGFVSFEPAIGGKWLETLKEISPRVARVGLIYNPKTHTGQHFASIETASRSLKVDPVRLSFADAEEIERKVHDFARLQSSGLLVLPDNSTNLHRDLIVSLARQYQLPTIYPFRHFVSNGGLAYYGTDSADIFRRAADYVDRILRGADPADLPVQAPSKFQLVINLKAAKAIGLDVPPHLQQLADEIIE
jgi:putative ABC transport system substrate-binding protein